MTSKDQDTYKEFSDLTFGNITASGCNSSAFNLTLARDLHPIICDYLYPKEYLSYLVIWLKNPKYNNRSQPYWENYQGIPVVTFDPAYYNSSIFISGICEKLKNINRHDIIRILEPYMENIKTIWRADRDLTITMIVICNLLERKDRSQIRWNYLKSELVNYFTIGTQEMGDIIPYDIEVIIENKNEYAIDLIKKSNDVDVTDYEACKKYILSMKKSSTMFRNEPIM